MTRSILITLSSLLIIGSVIPYIIDVIHKKTRPRLVTWFTWTFLAAISCAASASDHQYASATLSLTSAIGCISIFLLGIIYEGDKGIDKFDVVCQICAVIGLLLWLAFNSPGIAIIAGIAVDIIASLPTIRHSWFKPFEETSATFLLGGLGAVLTGLAATSFRVTAMAVPIYNTVINFLLLFILLNQRHRFKAAQAALKEYTYSK